jgi:hypothetical protein
MNTENPYMERFIAGFCQAGTPFSTKIERSQITNPLRLKAEESFDPEKMNFWDDGIGESLCYFGGGILGMAMIPVDFVLVGIVTVKKNFSVTM